MDPLKNPYAPGAGTPPPELAGRTQLIDNATVALRRTAIGRSSQSLILVGLRGVGKTVLLLKLSQIAQSEKFEVIWVEADEKKTLAELLLPGIRKALFAISTVESAKDVARRGLRVLTSFISTVKLSVGDAELGLTIAPEKGSADSGNLAADLLELMLALGEAARAAGKSVVILIDELQYLTSAELSALIMSIHRINQLVLPVFMVGAALPQIRGLAGTSKSYAERLFRFPEIGPLEEKDAIAAIRNPAGEAGVEFEDEAVHHILKSTRRYPYFLQQWSYEAWNIAEGDVVRAKDTIRADDKAIEALDDGFFKVRFDRCTPSERKYMWALAELGSGTQRSGEIASLLNVKSASVAPTRNSLMRKGMIYSPAHGDTAFTVPLFDQYMKRVMPLGLSSPGKRTRKSRKR